MTDFVWIYFVSILIAIVAAIIVVLIYGYFTYEGGDDGIE